MTSWREEQRGLHQVLDLIVEAFPPAFRARAVKTVLYWSVAWLEQPEVAQPEIPSGVRIAVDGVHVDG